MSTAVRGGPLATIVVRWTCCGSRTPIAARAWTCGPMPEKPWLPTSDHWSSASSVDRSHSGPSGSIPSPQPVGTTGIPK